MVGAAHEPVTYWDLMLFSVVCPGLTTVSAGHFTEVAICTEHIQ